MNLITGRHAKLGTISVRRRPGRATTKTVELLRDHGYSCQVTSDTRYTPPKGFHFGPVIEAPSLRPDPRVEPSDEPTRRVRVSARWGRQ